jgi:hypothetical protein
MPNYYTDNQGRNIQPVENENFKTPDINTLENITSYNDRTYNKIVKSASVSTTSIPQHISQIDPLRIKDEYAVLQPYYSDDYLNRLSNAVIFDDVISSALERLAYFTIGTSDEIRSVLYPEALRPINSELEAKNAIKELSIIKSAKDVAGSVVNNHLSDQEIRDFETYIHYTDKISKLGRFLKKNYRSAHIFGRSASFIEFSDHEIPSLNLKIGTPIGLKPLKSMLLGNVVVDPVSWEIKAAEYKDQKVKFKEYRDNAAIRKPVTTAYEDATTESGSKYLSSENLLYFVRNNNNMMRDQDDYWFGHSTLQSILPLSEESRRIKQIVIPQLNQSHWAGSMLWFFPNWTQEQMKAVFDSVKPASHVGIPVPDIKVQNMEIKPDYMGLIALMAELKKGILTAFGLPSFLMNFEDVTNRATAETVLEGFNESVIQSERSWITDILDEQWYAKIFRKYWPEDEFVHIKMKIMVEFENITFESFLAKAVAVVALYEKKMMTLTEVRNMLKLPPLQPNDYVELGIGTPATVDPVTGVPTAPNLVDTLVKQKAQQQQQQEETSGFENKKDAPSLSEMKTQLLNE